MAGLINQLMDILNEQTDIYTQLVSLSEEKKDVIIKNDVARLKSITSSENTLVGRNQRIDKQRLTVMGDIANVLNETPDSLTLSALAQRIEGQPEHGEFLNLAKKMQEVVQSLHELNEHNKVLLQSSLEYIDFSMNVIRSTNSPDYPTYGKGDGGGNKSILDVSN